MVGPDAVDRAVGQALAHGFDVFGASQRRVDLEERVVGGGELLGEQQVVGRHLGGDVDALRFAPANNVDGSSRGQVAHVQARADVLGQQDIASDDGFLGDGRPSRQAQLARQWRLVHLRALGQLGILAVLSDDAAEALDVLERAAHQDGVGDALSVVGEDPHARA